MAIPIRLSAGNRRVSRTVVCVNLHTLYPQEQKFDPTAFSSRVQQSLRQQPAGAVTRAMAKRTAEVNPRSIPRPLSPPRPNACCPRPLAKRTCRCPKKRRGKGGGGRPSACSFIAPAPVVCIGGIGGTSSRRCTCLSPHARSQFSAPSTLVTPTSRTGTPNVRPHVFDPVHAAHHG